VVSAGDESAKATFNPGSYGRQRTRPTANPPLAGGQGSSRHQPSDPRRPPRPCGGSCSPTVGLIFRDAVSSTPRCSPTDLCVRLGRGRDPNASGLASQGLAASGRAHRAVAENRGLPDPHRGCRSGPTCRCAPGAVLLRRLIVVVTAPAWCSART
jgi:hypothetical protein